MTNLVPGILIHPERPLVHLAKDAFRRPRGLIASCLSRYRLDVMEPRGDSAPCLPDVPIIIDGGVTSHAEANLDTIWNMWTA
jgi:hypothetical protein